MKATAASGHSSQVQKHASHVSNVSEGIEERDAAQAYGWINKLYTFMIIITFIVFTVFGQLSPPYSNEDCLSNRKICDKNIKCRSDCDLEDYIGNYNVWRLITIVLGVQRFIAFCFFVSALNRIWKGLKAYDADNESRSRLSLLLHSLILLLDLIGILATSIIIRQSYLS